jgi:hypothetical protein
MTSQRLTHRGDAHEEENAGVALLILILSSNAFATTWGREERPDPVIDGATCAVSEPMSWGSYIYHWPSKYDQVFFPLTDEHGIWFCRESGFTAFIGDFELRPEEKAALAAHLPQFYHRLDDAQRIRRCCCSSCRKVTASDNSIGSSGSGC